MDKLLVSVFVPVTGKTYDMFIHKQLMVFEALEMIKNAVAQLSDGIFVENSNNILCFLATGSVLNINKYVCESGLKNGSRLMLI